MFNDRNLLWRLNNLFMVLNLALVLVKLDLTISKSSSVDLKAFFLQFLETLLLRFPVQMHPELEDQCAVIRQRPLEGDRLFDGGIESLLAHATINPIDQRYRVPGA